MLLILGMGQVMAGWPEELGALEGKNLTLVEELAERARIDQEVRESMTVDVPLAKRDGLTALMLEVDKRNTAWLHGVLDRGWPTLSEHGQEATEDAWVLVQHGDHDVAFQARVLAELEELLKKKEVAPKELAYLHDRVARNQSRKQRYGTQGDCRDGIWVPDPTENPDQLDARRAEMGIKSLASYQAFFQCEGATQTPRHAYNQKDWATCHQGFAAQAKESKGPAAANDWYDAASCASLDGDVVQALAHLKAAMAEGFSRRELVGTDPDLEALRATGAFKTWWKE